MPKKVHPGQSLFEFARPAVPEPRIISPPEPQPVILNTDLTFGFANEEVAEKMANLFRRRSCLEDCLNFDLIKGAYLGYHQVETDGAMGVPQEVLQQLNTADIIALYFGIEKLKGRLITADLVGTTFGKLASALVREAYCLEPRDQRAGNAVRSMAEMQLGFSGHRLNRYTIGQRADALPEEAKIQFLRTFFTERYQSQEHRRGGDGIWDVVYEHHQFHDGRAKDSNAARDEYCAEFVQLMRRKAERKNDFCNTRFRGKLVKGSQGGDYLVQRNASLRGDSHRYDCSCPHGYRRMYGGLDRTQPETCKHINLFKAELGN